ncbi:unnamed protein product [Polarella glacialis]|uniref:Uncharacterized protein n=1 Tax=Polarella glacialis TaxID=89957 RepID=A0A813HVP5_POLGL|nr:unnamed protein product [Polarella glacialis]
MGASPERHSAHVVLTELLAGDFAAVLRSSPPPDWQRYGLGVWLFARGMAQLGADPNLSELAELPALLSLPSELRARQKVMPSKYGRLNAAAIVQVYGLLLASELQRVSRRSGAKRPVGEAVEVASALPYDEPPAFYAAPRAFLGEALLRGGDAYGAKAMFELEVESRSPFQPYALFGLHRACKAMGHGQASESCAADAERRFTAAWGHGDSALQSPTQARPLRALSRWHGLARSKVLTPGDLNGFAGLAAGLVAVAGVVLASRAARHRPEGTGYRYGDLSHHLAYEEDQEEPAEFNHNINNNSNNNNCTNDSNNNNSNNTNNSSSNNNNNQQPDRGDEELWAEGDQQQQPQQQQEQQLTALLPKSKEEEEEEEEQQQQEQEEEEEQQQQQQQQQPQQQQQQQQRQQQQQQQPLVSEASIPRLDPPPTTTATATTTTTTRTSAECLLESEVPQSEVQIVCSPQERSAAG